MDFIKFIEVLNKDEGGMRIAFANKIRSPNMDDEELEQFFIDAGYDKITREECKRIIEAVHAVGKAKAGEIVLQY